MTSDSTQQAGPGAGADIGIVCPTAPERIWLQVDPEPEDEGVPVYPTNPSVDDVTWCRDKINNTDTLYIRADLAAPLAVEDSRERCASEDAKRLDWLQQNFRTCSLYMDGNHRYAPTHGVYNMRGPTFRAAIDAAMAAASSGQEKEKGQ